MRERNRNNVVVWILLAIIVVLLLVVLYALLIRPAYQQYVYDKQMQAYNTAQTDFLNGMLVQLEQSGFVQIQVGNQTLYLAPFDPSATA